MSIKIDYDEIKANSACRISFNKSQNLMELLGETLAGDAKNIENMANTFQAIEQSLSDACINE